MVKKRAFFTFYLDSTTDHVKVIKAMKKRIRIFLNER